MVEKVESTPQTDGSRGLWSPLAIFFLGTNFAALNWWRMGWKHKAIAFLGVFVIVGLFLTWVRIGPPYTDSTTLSGFLLFLPFVIFILYRLLLAFVVSRDIQTFNLSGEKTNAVNWTIVFAFALTTFAVSAGIVFGSDYLAGSTKYCRFPRLQDLLYANDVNNRSGLRQMLMNRFDSECSVAWGLENDSIWYRRNEEPKSSDSLLYVLAGRQTGVSTSFIAAHQVVELYSQPITQAMVDSRVEHSGVKIAVELPSNLSHAKLFRYNCFQDEEYQTCIIALGYERILIWFEASQSGFTDSAFEQALIEIIRNVDQRVSDYEASLH